jgi:hypothetical protein
VKRREPYRIRGGNSARPSLVEDCLHLCQCRVMGSSGAQRISHIDDAPCYGRHCSL